MIDLIIPLYNAEDTIEQLLGSICAQTKKHSVIVTFIDDHSTDNSVKIIEKWKEIIPFPIKIITPPEKLTYPGLVRQYGIDNTYADYIMFLDSDDELLPRAFEYLSNGIRYNNADVVVGHFDVETGVMEEYEQGIDKGGFTWLHGNIYKRQFLEDNKIRFFSGYNEDGSFNLECLLLANKICECEKTVYIWRNNKYSLTRSNNNFILDNIDDVINGYSKAYQHCRRIVGNTNIDLENFYKKYWKNCIGHLRLFYNFYNSYILENIHKNELNKIQSLIDDFLEDTLLRQYLIENKNNDEIKKLLVENLKTEYYTYVTLNEFLSIFDIYIDLRPNKLIEKYGGIYN
jgi:glycosyltransferase involved in cell wall biosynthesis